MFQPLPQQTEKTAHEIVDASYRVHKTLGPGLLESVYELCLTHELERRGLKVARQVGLPIVYGDVRLDAGLRLDMVVADSVIVELKSVESIIPLFKAQVLTYLKLSGLRLGLLINFNVAMIKDGIVRVVL